MRVQLAELQRRYKEKQRELARLQRRHDHEYGPGWQWGGPGGGSAACADAPSSGQRRARPSPGPSPCGQGSTCVCGGEWGLEGGRPGKVPRGGGTMRQSPSRETKVRYGVGWKKYAAKASAGQRLVLGWWGKG